MRGHVRGKPHAAFGQRAARGRRFGGHVDHGRAAVGVSARGAGDEGVELGREAGDQLGRGRDVVVHVAKGGGEIAEKIIETAREHNVPLQEDAALAKAIARAGNVVLAASYLYDENTAVRMWRRVDPIAPLLEAGALSGLARVPFDPDQFVTAKPTGPGTRRSSSRAIASA